MKRIEIKAVISGLATDIVGSMIIGVVIGVLVVFIAKNNGGVTPENLKAIQSNVFLKFVGLLGTTFSTALGGYVAAKLSKPNGAINALTVGLLSLTLGIALALLAPNLSPNWKVILGIIVTVPAAIIGGIVAFRSDGLTHSSGTPNSTS